MYEVHPVLGLPDVRPGDDVAALVAARFALRDGDVVVVTSKVVSKAEGRLVPAGADREATRLQAVEDETLRVVARRGTTTIAETRHGLVMAAAGVDGSNVRGDEIALLPRDPDASARELREEIERNLKSSRRYIDKPATETHLATRIEAIDLEDIIVRDVKRLVPFTPRPPFRKRNICCYGRSHSFSLY